MKLKLGYFFLTSYLSTLGLSAYDFFDPTPKEKTSEIITDRPNRTESAHSVEPGHFQMEADFINSTINLKNRSSETVYFWPNMKMGLTENSDLQLVIQSYVNSHDGQESVSGFGDITVRYKYNLFGNRTDNWALGIMPYLNFPTHNSKFGEGKIEGGVLIPFAKALPMEWGLGGMAEFDSLYHDPSEKYYLSSVFSLTTSHPIVGELSGYAEIWTQIEFLNRVQFNATFDVGLTYLSSPQVQWDMGMNTTVTQNLEAINPFVGISFKN